MNDNLPKRKPIRLENFDCGAGYAYFITVCTQNRNKTLSTIVGEGSALPQLTKQGEIIKNLIENIPPNYMNFSIDYYVIMPNHIHMLITVVDDGRANPSPTITSFIGWLKFQATKEIFRITGDSNQKIFQRSFHDHVIRNREDYEQISRYIYENPLNWETDEFYN